MIKGSPSRTALGAAVLRALHQDLDEPVLTDPLAWTILGGREAALPGTEGWQDSKMGLFLAARHRFAEDSLAAAVARGTRQAVFLGAGLDTFGYRSPWPDLRVFEVDHPDTGLWKHEQLAAAGIEVPASVAHVAVDFERDSLLERLVGSGFDVSASTFFVWLGVVPYLTHQAATQTLRAIASVPDAEVVFDHTLADVGAHEGARADRARLEARVADVGEPLRAGWDPAELHALLGSLGFAEVEEVSRLEIRSRYLGLPATGSRGGGRIVRARVGG